MLSEKTIAGNSVTGFERKLDRRLRDVRTSGFSLHKPVAFFPVLSVNDMFADFSSSRFQATLFLTSSVRPRLRVLYSSIVNDQYCILLRRQSCDTNQRVSSGTPHGVL